MDNIIIFLQKDRELLVGFFILPIINLNKFIYRDAILAILLVATDNELMITLIDGTNVTIMFS